MAHGFEAESPRSDAPSCGVEILKLSSTSRSRGSDGENYAARGLYRFYLEEAMALPDNAMRVSEGWVLKILIADDNPRVRKAICRVLLTDSRLSQHLEAINGADAVQIAKTENPDLVVLDLSMPVLNGLDAATLIRQALPEVPIVLVSMHGEILKEEDLKRFGISALVSKERAATELIPVVRSLLGLG